MEFSKSADRRKRLVEKIAFGIARSLSFGIVGVLALILGFIVQQGFGVLSWDFLTEGPQNGMTEGGIFPAIVGTLCLVAGSLLFAVPIGVMAGIYVNEYETEGPTKRFIKMMTNNLAGVPSIIFGLFGMALFVNKLGFGASILAGSLTLGLLALPVIIRTTEESLKAVPDTFRHASYGLGASRWYTVRNVVLPAAMPKIGRAHV